MLVGAQHLITFDHRVFNFRSNNCSYLLAHDFADHNFSVVVQYGSNEKPEPPTLLVLLEEDTIKINLSDDVSIIYNFFIWWLYFPAAEYSNKRQVRHKTADDDR